MVLLLPPQESNTPSALETHCRYLYKNRDMRAGAFHELMVDRAVGGELKWAISRRRLGRLEDSSRSELETGRRGSSSSSQQDPPLHPRTRIGADVGHRWGVHVLRFADIGTRLMLLDRGGGRFARSAFGSRRYTLAIHNGPQRTFPDARCRVALGNSSHLNLLGHMVRADAITIMND